MSEKFNHQRRRFLDIATMTIATTQLGRFGSAIAQSSKAQPKESATTQPRTAHTGTTAIRPFRINISKEALVNLRRRITATQWPEKETVTDLSRLSQSHLLQPARQRLPLRGMGAANDFCSGTQGCVPELP
jgi:hypothetical protein